MSNEQELNVQTLELELKWFTEVLNTRLKVYLKQDTNIQSIYEIQPPDISAIDSIYAKVVRENNFSFDERIVLILALIPHIRPELLDILFMKNEMTDKCFSEFGGQNNYNNHQGFLPTGETAVFILSANDLNNRFIITEYFKSTHAFYKNRILYLDNSAKNEPFLSGALCISDDYFNLLTSGSITESDYSTLLPARLITTALSWDDMVLDEFTLQEVQDIQTWVNHRNYLSNDVGLKNKAKPGYRALFKGPEGTGKTTVACLIGKTTGLDVYQINLSQIVSSPAGETEKNLAWFFDVAENKNRILFFDEADAVFGKRVSSTSSDDIYGNQAAAYLLQRIEDYNGLVILASNAQANMDEAFARKFQSMVTFHLPGVQERFKIWQNVFSGTLELDESTDLQKVAEEYAISGGSIINV